MTPNSLLYSGDTCIACGLDDGAHVGACPGAEIERLQARVATQERRLHALARAATDPAEAARAVSLDVVRDHLRTHDWTYMRTAYQGCEIWWHDRRESQVSIEEEWSEASVRSAARACAIAESRSASDIGGWAVVLAAWVLESEARRAL